MTRFLTLTAIFCIAFSAAIAGDTITVTPPPGYLAIPESLVVPEEGAGVLFIFEEGMM